MGSFNRDQFRADIAEKWARATGRHDAAESAFFARQLEDIRGRAYDYKLIELKARMFLPVDNSVNPGAESVTYSQFTPRSLAKIIASYADDLPRSDSTGLQFTAQIKGIGGSYGYSIQEIRAAQMAGLPLDQRRANAARRGVEVVIDKIAQSGDSDYKLVGFFNQPSATTFTVPAGVSGFTDWARKNPGEILSDMNGVANFIVSNTSEVEKPDTLLVPIKQYTQIATTPMNSANASNVTILDMFLKNQPFVQMVAPWYALTGAGAGSTDRMICYKRDPDHLMLVIPQEFEQFPPQQRNLEFVVNCHARCGGVQVPYPLAIAYADGV